MAHRFSSLGRRRGAPLSWKIAKHADLYWIGIFGMQTAWIHPTQPTE
jgi:hypothetical protein